MKPCIFSTLVSIFISSAIASTGDLIVKEEYDSCAFGVKWEIFKQNEDELYVAKGYRGQFYK